MYKKPNGSITKRNCKRFISILGIRHRIVSLMMLGSLPLLLGATCGFETCDIFNCDTLPFIEELLSADEHAEDTHDDTMDGMADDHDDMDGMEDEHDDADGMGDEHDDMDGEHDDDMPGDDDDHMDDDHDGGTDGDDHDADAEDHDEDEEG